MFKLVIHVTCDQFIYYVYLENKDTQYNDLLNQHSYILAQQAI